MAELTIEQKAKAYDEAIERVQKYIKECNGGTLFKVEEIFPELAESEDERVRKDIISLVIKWWKDDGEVESKFSSKNSMLAWLEKQGEHANFRNKIQIGDKVTRNEYGVLVNLSQLKRVAKKDEKQCEQKPVDKVKPKFEVGDVMRSLEEAKEGITDGLPVVVSIDEEYYHCNNELISIKDQDKYEYPPMNRKQKYAEWSEEDENKIRLFMQLTEGCDNYKELQYWLKTLKYRCVFHIKQNWSKEDEINLFECIKAIKGNYSTAYAQELSEWLKSLRPQNRWKPSDEQLKLLKHIMENVPLSYIDKSEVGGLYLDLKRLIRE